MDIQYGLTGIALENGYDIVKARGVAVVGMSPGNSYFKRDVIDDLLSYCADRFSHVKILVADKPAKHTYLAIGYSPAKAETKARLYSNNLKNHSQRSIDTILQGDVELLSWENQIDTNKDYRDELVRIESMYSDHSNFRRDVRSTTSAVLDGKLKQGILLDSAVDEGVYYLLKELAFISACPKILDVDRVAYVYHNRWKVCEDFIGGKFDGQKRMDLGFVMIR